VVAFGNGFLPFGPPRKVHAEVTTIRDDIKGRGTMWFTPQLDLGARPYWGVSASVEASCVAQDAEWWQARSAVGIGAPMATC